MKFLQVYAVVDSEYRVLWVGGEWDEFALNGGATTATSNAVLSTSVMAHIAGAETRAETARMIDAVLQHKRTLRLEYRCDSPSMARKFLMTIQPMKDDRALMVHDLKDAWHFSPPPEPLALRSRGPGREVLVLRQGPAGGRGAVDLVRRYRRKTSDAGHL